MHNNIFRNNNNNIIVFPYVEFLGDDLIINRYNCDLQLIMRTNGHSLPLRVPRPYIIIVGIGRKLLFILTTKRFGFWSIFFFCSHRVYARPFHNLHTHAARASALCNNTTTRGRKSPGRTQSNMPSD